MFRKRQTRLIFKSRNLEFLKFGGKSAATEKIYFSLCEGANYRHLLEELLWIEKIKKMGIENFSPQFNCASFVTKTIKEQNSAVMGHNFTKFSFNS